MGSVRGLWLVNINNEEIIYSKRFPSVEVRFKRSLGKNYTPLPSNNDLINEILTKCSTTFDEFVPERDSVKGPHQWPVVELSPSQTWPVVYLKKNNLLYVAVVPYEPLSDGQRPPLIRIISVPAAISLLAGMSDILEACVDMDHLKSTSGPVLELSQFILTTAPFGTPSDTNPVTVKLQQQFKKSSVIPKEKVPAWRPAVYKGASRISLTIKEQIQSAQYDKTDIPDVSMLYGSVVCKAELEGHPDVILSLTTAPGSAPLDHLIVHPCVQAADVDPVTSTSLPTPDGSHTRKIRFSSPLEVFTLCHYQCSSGEVPIRGFYQMKGDKSVELLVQLKLMENVKNSFEFCEVYIPFFNRGPIEKVDNLRPTSANISLTDNKRCIVWNIGTRFPPKNLEMSLGASVSFVEYPPEDQTPVVTLPNNKQESIDEKFSAGQNSFCEVRFKMSDYTLSSCSIDHRAITLIPQIKFKSSLVREVTSSSYRIWNSHGDVMGMPNITDFVEDPNQT